MRAASLAKRLREKDKVSDWVLVLPPWPHLYHWRTRKLRQEGWPWERFFDVESLSEYIPSIEFDEFLKKEGHTMHEVGGCDGG